MEDFGSIADGFFEGRRALGHDHEFLEVDRRIGVGPAVDDVHHRDGEDLGVGAAEVFIKREVQAGGGGFGDGEADTEDGVGAEIGFVGGPVEAEHDAVEHVLGGRAFAEEGRGNHIIHALHGLLHALAEEALFVAVTQFPGFVFTGGGAAGHHGPAECAALEEDVDFDGGIPAGIDDFATGDLLDAES